MTSTVKRKYNPLFLTTVFLSGMLLGLFICRTETSLATQLSTVAISTLAFYLTQIKIGLFLKIK